MSKLIRIELGTSPVTPSDVRGLLGQYGSGDDLVIEMVALAQECRRPGEWSQYQDVYSKPALTLFANERAASVVQKYEPSVIPGLFQTEDYARALLRALGSNPLQVERLLEARIRRQEILDSPGSPQLDLILGEASISRPVGGASVMLAQIERLKIIATSPNISMRFLAFSRGPHPGMGSAFTILQFSDPLIPDLLYLESDDREMVTREDYEEIALYKERFVTLTELSSSPDDFNMEVDQVSRYRYSERSE